LAISNCFVPLHHWKLVIVFGWIRILTVSKMQMKGGFLG